MRKLFFVRKDSIRFPVGCRKRRLNQDYFMVLLVISAYCVYLGCDVVDWFVPQQYHSQVIGLKTRTGMYRLGKTLVLEQFQYFVCY